MNKRTLIEVVIGLVLIFVVTYIFFSPAFSGKTLPQGDITQYTYSAKEAVDYRSSNGETPLWNSRMFGGMPGYQITGVNYTVPLFQLIGFTNLPHPAGLLFKLLVFSFVMFLCFGLRPLLAALGSLVYSFSSYNLILVEAGHNTKVEAIAYAAIVLGGLALLWRRKYVLGTALTALGMALQVGANHLQITYYLGLIIVAWFISELVRAIREKSWKPFILTASLALAAALIGIASNSVNLLLTQEYMTETIRGKTELTITPDNKPKEDITGGLDRDYAFQWSQGLGDVFTFIVPNIVGGGSSTYVGTKSETYEALKRQGNPQARQIAESYPITYWGALPFTSGPEYFGALVVFLFVLGFFMMKGPYKWWFLVVFALSLLMSMGKNFGLLNNLLFDYFPLYNKFRSVNMAQVMAQIVAPIFAMMALHELFKEKQAMDVVKNALLKALYITGGFCLFVLVLGGTFDPSSENDSQLGGLVDAVKSDRIKLMRMDALRSLAFIAVGFLTLWYWLKGKLKKDYALGIIAFASFIDLWTVDRRFIDAKSFVKPNDYQQAFQPTPADLQILQDKSNYRVFDGTANAFNSARASYFHRSVGGYHAAKLRRVQDVIEFHIVNNNMNIMNMLNTKYIIQNGQEGQPPVVSQNPGALGNAWFVNSYRMVNNADEEILALKDFNPANEAIVDKRFDEQIKGLSIVPDSNASIELSYFSPDTMKYSYQTGSEQLAVFSEIYYNSSKGWQAYLNGEKVDHLRCNYLLRGMKLPAGKGEITFVFEPQNYARGKQIAGISSILVFALLGIGIIMALKDWFSRKNSDASSSN